MQGHMYISENVLILLVLSRILSAQSSKSLEDILKNSSKYGNRAKNTDNDDFDLKRQIMKTLEQCSSNKSKYTNRFNEQSEETYGRYNQNGNMQWNMGNNRNNRNSENNGHNKNYYKDGDLYYGDSNRNDFNINNNRGQSNDNVENQQECGPSNYGPPSGFPGYSDGYLNNHYSSYERNIRNCDSAFKNNNNNYGNRDLLTDTNARNNYGDYPYGQRKRRSDNNNNRENENQCTSQCVFGKMRLLDDDNMPSETLALEWVRNNIATDDMKRITTLRELRKCFARLTTTDFDDGCEYSKELAQCLNLNIE